MISLIIFLLASYGATNIITSSKLLRPCRDLCASRHWVLKKLGEMLACPMCTGFWVGLFWYAALLGSAWKCRFDFEWLAFSSMASGFCWIVYVIMQKFGESEL